MSTRKDVFVSAVVIRPDQQHFQDDLAALSTILSSNYLHYEIVVINTVSTNDVFEEKVDAALKQIKHIRYIKVFNNVDDNILFAAGIENTIGDIIVASYPEFLTEHNIRESVDLCFAGNDVVNGLSKTKTGLLHKISRQASRKILSRLISYNIPYNDTFFRCISRRALNGAIGTRHFHRFVFLRLANTGEKQTCVELDCLRPCKAESRRFLDSFSRAVSAVIFNSTFPLRIMNVGALFGCFITLLIAVYTIAIKLLKDKVVEGWPTMMLASSCLFFFLFMILTFTGEYLIRIIFDNNTYAPYHVLAEKHSSVMLNYNELNIREDSVSSEVNLTQTGRDR